MKLSDWHVTVHQSAVDGKWFATAGAGAVEGLTVQWTPRWSHWRYTGHHATPRQALEALERVLRAV